MSEAEPDTSIDERYSSPGAVATPWSRGREIVEQGEVFWVVTVRPDGRPHATPLLAVWVDGAVVFTTGPEERKARNLEHESGCLLLTSDTGTGGGPSVVVEGRAEPVTGEAELTRVVDAFVAKYGEAWRYDVVDGALRHHVESGAADQPGRVLAFRLRPVTAFGFSTADPYSQTRWTFDS